MVIYPSVVVWKLAWSCQCPHMNTCTGYFIHSWTLIICCTFDTGMFSLLSKYICNFVDMNWVFQCINIHWLLGRLSVTAICIWQMKWYLHEAFLNAYRKYQMLVSTNVSRVGHSLECLFKKQQPDRVILCLYKVFFNMIQNAKVTGRDCRSTYYINDFRFMISAYLVPQSKIRYTYRKSQIKNFIIENKAYMIFFL